MATTKPGAINCTGPTLRQCDIDALLWLRDVYRGATLISKVEVKAVKDGFGGLESPSLATLRRLDKLGLLVITEEEDDWTPMVEITEEGVNYLTNAANMLSYK